MDIERIFDRPGATWEVEERQFVTEWLYLPTQHRRLLLFALRNLGSGATPDDAEDTWQEFCVVELHRRVINRYDPARGKRFWSYLRYPCFRQFCWLKGAEIRKRASQQPPMGDAVVDAVDQSSPFDASLMRADSVRLCLDKLDPRCRTLITMAYFKEMSGEEIASAVGMSQVHVRVTLLRCRHCMKHCLVANAWV
jgi:RNA polymerase sigma factor (sigma-70 family)